MLKHSDIWRALDRLASAKGISVSGLAKVAGLDPTTFNKSKRSSDEGKLRWPSTESIAKVLEATETPLLEFISLIEENGGANAVQRVPMIDLVHAARDGYFDEQGFPVGKDWDDLLFPNTGDPQVYALEIGDNRLEPIYREGVRLIVSPAAHLRRGDRVVVKTRAGEVIISQLLRENATRIELRSLMPPPVDRVCLREDVLWEARIVWASQ